MLMKIGQNVGNASFSVAGCHNRSALRCCPVFLHGAVECPEDILSGKPSSFQQQIELSEIHPQQVHRLNAYQNRGNLICLCDYPPQLPQENLHSGILSQHNRFLQRFHFHPGIIVFAVHPIHPVDRLFIGFPDPARIGNDFPSFEYGSCCRIFFQLLLDFLRLFTA